MTTTIDAYISELRETVVAAGLNYDVWWALRGPDTAPKYQKEMQRHNLFFSTSARANLVAALVALYRIYEGRRDSYNIPGLIKLLRGRFSEKELRDIEALNSQAKPIWVKVCILRNKVFGHRAKSHTIEEAFSEAGVTPNDIVRLLDITRKFLNKVSLAHDKTTHAFNLEAQGDTVRLLKELGGAMTKRSNPAVHTDLARKTAQGRCPTR